MDYLIPTLHVEGAHTFALDHTTFGAGDTVPTNPMAAGGFHIVPALRNVSGSAPLTAEWVLEVPPNGSALRVCEAPQEARFVQVVTRIDTPAFDA